MRIAVTGTPNRIAELERHVSSEHELVKVKNNNFFGFDVVFDLTFDETPQQIKWYAELNDVPVVVGAVKKQVEETIFAHAGRLYCRLIGMNTLPTFIDRPVAELTVTKPHYKSMVNDIFEKLGWEHQIVESRVGMVTPRVVAMIINEAYFTFQEGTASKEDIDTGMKLGTAYPYGPFEWCDRIGIKNIYETLDAVYHDTHDERYKICPLLRTEYLNSRMIFG